MSIKSNLVILISSLMLSSPVAFAKDVQEPPAPGSGNDGVGKLILAKDLLADGIKQYNAKDYATALKRFDTVVGMEPKNLSAFYHRGLTNKSLGKADAAKKDFKTATTLDASTAEDFELRGKAFQECGQKAKADADFAKAKTIKI